MDDLQLNEILKKRFEPRAPDGLAQRITARSYHETQDKVTVRPGVVATWKTLLGEFLVLPQPAFAVAALVIFGFAAGLFGYDSVAGDAVMGTEDLSSFMVISDQFVATQFLEEVSS